MGLEILETDDSVKFTVRVIPRSSRTEIFGEHDGALKIKLRSPPVDGAANDELIRFLSKTFSVSRSDIEIISGQTTRTKRVSVSGITREQIDAILPVKI
ncbi:MAG: YggU family protein [Acidobacteria bacterium]|nr:MAG: YggU family protein [Acidobacteriota bacterium]